jgi:hypothetical protein
MGRAERAEAEVARLRELLNRAIEIADKSLDCLIPVFRGEHEEIETELKRLKAEAKFAPAPEKLVLPPTDLNYQNKENTLALNEWREIGPDEMIQEGDEVFTLGMWVEISPTLVIPINEKENDNRKFRTRRPLPKQEEMPLEYEIETIWEHSEQIDSLTGHMAFKALAKSIRYLRYEIQKLKEAQ